METGVMSVLRRLADNKNPGSFVVKNATEAV